MLDILEVLAGLPDVASLLAGIARFWRISVSCFVAGAALALLFFWFDSPAIRLIAGFHIVVGVVTGGVIWETRRGRLRPDRR